ncbi:LysR family transcriptional regulator [Nocardia caishijiensis]|uniref:DNA-binding transcriptional LysR family regulator n=1 Tax=Nocardia caishijiensis TaxID=184756 RepID=A0ABQ6YI84_9NOCA|nr:LysR family transcriptional regulator [Nocardia caishijiensis]KAF0845502.1 DNA-binding transcriptional LysR family regulator [Nocardia caishijiensis]
MLDVRKLRLLRELARRGTIAAVAEALSYTPSAVSQQLSALEKDAGVALLERSGRRVTLTPSAHLLVGHTETVLAALERADAELAGARTALVGTLRIGAFPTAARTLLSPALVALSTEHPHLELTVTEIDPAGVPDALRAGTLDIALTHDYDLVPADRDRALHTEPLHSETVYLATRAAVPADNPLRAHRDSPWIAGTPGTLCHTMTIRACQATGFTPRVRHHADDFDTVLALVAAGAGIAIIPGLALYAPPEHLVLTPLSMRRHTHLAYRDGTGDHPAVRAARSALHDAAAGRHAPARGA